MQIRASTDQTRPGSSYRSHPPSERWLLGTAAPAPPASDRYEPPGGEDWQRQTHTHTQGLQQLCQKDIIYHYRLELPFPQHHTPCNSNGKIFVSANYYY